MINKNQLLIDYLKIISGEERTLAIFNAQSRNFKDFGFEDGEQMLDELEIDDDELMTAYDQGYLEGISYVIKKIVLFSNLFDNE